MRKLATRVKSCLDWASVGDKQAWQCQLSDFMDIHTINEAEEDNGKQDQVNIFGNSARVLPENCFGWDMVNNIPSFIMTFICLMRTNNSSRPDLPQWLNQRGNGNNSNVRGANKRATHLGFRHLMCIHVNAIKKFDSKLEVRFWQFRPTCKVRYRKWG